MYLLIPRSNQPKLKEISPEYSLEGLMLKLKLQYFGHLMWRTDSLEETLMLGEIESGRRRGRQRVRWLDGITYLMEVCLRKLRVMVNHREAWCAAVHGVSKSRTRPSDGTATVCVYWPRVPNLSPPTSCIPSPRVTVRLLSMSVSLFLFYE